MKKKEKLVEIIEIWQKSDKGEAYHFGDQAALKLVVYLINGHPITLEKGFYLERYKKHEKEVEHMLK